MSKLKIELMHEMFGKGYDGDTCKTCWHLKHHYTHNKSYYKCQCYGETPSEASDWRLKYPSCGLYNKPYLLGRTVMELKKHDGHKKEKIQVKGQIGLFDE